MSQTSISVSTKRKRRIKHQVFDGWTEDISQLREYGKLPAQVKTIIEFIEGFTGGRVVIVSVGADREAIIVK